MKVLKSYDTIKKSERTILPGGTIITKSRFTFSDHFLCDKKLNFPHIFAITLEQVIGFEEPFVRILNGKLCRYSSLSGECGNNFKEMADSNFLRLIETNSSIGSKEKFFSLIENSELFRKAIEKKLSYRIVGKENSFLNLPPIRSVYKDSLFYETKSPFYLDSPKYLL